MLKSIERFFPNDVTYTRPEGGMFLWAELPRRFAALDLFERAVKDKVIFVPGDPFYVNKTRMNTLRLNFSCVDENSIELGMERLGNAIGELTPQPNKRKGKFLTHCTFLCGKEKRCLYLDGDSPKCLRNNFRNEATSSYPTSATISSNGCRLLSSLS